MIKLDVGISGKTVFDKSEMIYLPAALIPYFIMFAGKTVEIKIEPGGPFTCLDNEKFIFQLNNSRFKLNPDIAKQALNKGKKYEVGKTYYLSIKEVKKILKAKKTKPKKKKK